MKKETREVFISDDGQSFDSEQACIAHEKKVAANAKRIEKLKVYCCSSQFEQTEGRGYGKITYIITDCNLSLVADYCANRFGRVLQPWYGSGCYEAWLLSEASIDCKTAIYKVKTFRPRGSSPLPGTLELVKILRNEVDHPDFPKENHYQLPE